jgi:hypothetical protein
MNEIPLRRRATESGMSIIVGSVDASGTPACCRGIALISADQLKTATVYVPLATSRDIVANAAITRRLAVVASHPITHVSVQVKGTVRELRLAGDGEEELVRDRMGRFADIITDIGVPRRLSRSLNCWPAFAIELAIDDVYEQTPGPNAGDPIK